MFDAGLVTASVVFLGLLGAGGIGYAILTPLLAKRDKGARRLSAVARAEPGGKRRGSAPDANAQRRKQVQDTLKELEAAQAARKKRPTLRRRIEQAGLEITERSFIIVSAATGLTVAGLLFATGQAPAIALLAGFAAGFGLPRWVLGYLARRRLNQFAEEFANAVDVIVRGVKAGLPLHDCLHIIANESAEPVRTEFKELCDSQRMGVPIDQALEKLAERVPLAEVNFFHIVISIQQKTGGNLSEALGNLSKVLRDRKLLKGKIAAMSQEAKSSALIIGSLPPGVMALVYLSTPEYINLLFDERMGHAMLIAGAVWMMIGVVVMRRMIRFDY